MQDDQFAGNEKHGKNLEKCDERSKCNNRAITPEACYSVEYQKSDKLQMKPEHSKQCRFALRPLGCYHVDSPKGAVKKGCVADITAAEITKLSTKPMEYVTCAGTNCNSRNSILSCLACKSKRPNDECALNRNRIPLKVCKNYHGKCYARISANSMFARGCLEDATEEVANDCSDPANIRCELCDGDSGCNNQYVREKCLEQEYRRGSAAIVTPSSSVRCRLQSKPMGCYHFEDTATGSVKKGCVGHLSDEQFAIYARQMPNFQICLGESCNSRYELFSCLRCESVAGNDTCISAFEHVDSVVCGKYRDECYTRVIDENIERGCLSSLSRETTDACRGAPQKCSTCGDRRNCNDLPKKHEHCYTFDSNPSFRQALESASNEPQSVACRLSVPRLGCYHYEVPGKRITRKGCVSELQPSQLEFYAKQKQHFFKCSSDNCNSGETITSCFTCQSNGVDGHCVTDLSNVSVNACPKYGDKCYTRISNGNQYQRGCLSEASDIVAKACDSKMMGKCEVCGDSKCNDHTATDHCVSCNSAHDAKCRQQPTEVGSVQHCSMKSPLDSSQPAGCYLKYNGDDTIRGCAEDLDGSDLHECSSTSSATCQICNGHRCNERASFRQSCYKCTSAVLNSCLDLSEPTLAAKCWNYTDSCLVGVDASGLTHRACGHDTQAKLDFPHGYKICHGEQCNDFVYPKGRLRCLQCKDCAKTFDRNHDLGICEVYSTSNRCYTLKEGSLSYHSLCYRRLTLLMFDGFCLISFLVVADGKVNRGCVSDNGNVTAACMENPEKCLICEGKGCNDKVMNHSPKTGPMALLIAAIIAMTRLL